jgi:hypothetical protein
MGKESELGVEVISLLHRRLASADFLEARCGVDCSASAPNPALQGTLRDKAAPLP